MKKRHIYESYWLTLQQRLVDSGFVTITINPANGKNYWSPTLKGIKAYKTVLELTKRNRLFKGPKFTEDEINEFRYTDERRYEASRIYSKLTESGVSEVVLVASKSDIDY